MTQVENFHIPIVILNGIESEDGLLMLPKKKGRFILEYFTSLKLET